MKTSLLRAAGPLCALLVPLLLGCAAPPPPAEAVKVLTVAEASGYNATATYAETVELMDRLANPGTFVGSRLLRRASMGKTGEGRDIPLLILADPPVSDPQTAYASGKAIVLVFANIHAGEVCGKEALPMLVREIVSEPAAPWARKVLDHVVLVVAPIYNADGNERFGPNERNRPGQVGPAMMGQRANAQGLDLNRDYMKLDAPETRAMAHFFTTWRPHMVIDCHTTNGSLHRYTLTYGASQLPAGDTRPLEWTRNVLLPTVSERVLKKDGFDTFWYGDFNAFHTEWRTYPWNPRYGANYAGLRGMVAILSEAYAYAPFKDRVLSTLAFVRECVIFAAENRVALIKVVEDARREAAKGEPAEVPIRFEYATFAERLTVKGWQMRPKDGGGVESTGVEKDYTDVEFWGRFVPTMTVERPRAYLVPPTQQAVIDNLRAHGVRMEEERIERTAEVEEYVVVSVEDRPEFQQRQMRLAEVEKRAAERRIGPGWVRVPVDQELGTLAVYLLEPGADDGLAAWDFFGGELVGGGVYPIVRIPR